MTLKPIKRLDLDETGELIAVRSLVSVILGYVLLYSPEVEKAGSLFCFAAVAAHLLSNAVLHRFARKLLSLSWFLGALFLADLGLISWVIALAAGAGTDLYLVYFLVILMSGIQRNARLSFVVGATGCVLYGFLWSKNNPVEDLFDSGMMLRFPFFFIVAFFSSYFAQRTQKSEQALEKSESHLARAEKLAAVGRLAGGMAHEFNNLLMALSGTASLLHDSLDESDARRKDTETILHLSVKAASLVSHLLNFSRKQTVFPVRVDLHSFFNEKRRALREIMGENVEIRIDWAEGVTEVVMDPHQLWQLISSLSANAREAMQGRGIFWIRAENLEREKLPPSLHLPEAGPHVKLSLSDNGCGMSPEVAARAFEPFLTTKEVGQGTGLSLASAHGIVVRAGGDIRVDTVLGRGTTFEIYLPAAGAAPRPGAPVRAALKRPADA